MAGVLEILVVRGWEDWSERDRTACGGAVSLADGLRLIPLTEATKHRLGEVDGPPVLGFYKLSAAVAAFAASCSAAGPCAYFDLEYHGGGGYQASVVWSDGAVTLGPMFTATPSEGEDHYTVIAHRRDIGGMAINAALRHLGVQALPGDDEFGSVGLERYRWTDQWAAIAEPVRE
jgi:hypothetical protein